MDLRTPRPFAHLLLLGVLILSNTGCGHIAARELRGAEAAPPADFKYLGDMYPCYLELKNAEVGLRVNCFELDGTLHIHSSRWANLPPFSGESWTVTIRRVPYVRVEIDEKIYLMTASLIEDEKCRKQVLYDRGYFVAWDAITVFRFVPRK